MGACAAFESLAATSVSCVIGYFISRLKGVEAHEQLVLWKTSGVISMKINKRKYLSNSKANKNNEQDALSH